MIILLWTRWREDKRFFWLTVIGAWIIADVIIGSWLISNGTVQFIRYWHWVTGT